MRKNIFGGWFPPPPRRLFSIHGPPLSSLATQVFAWDSQGDVDLVDVACEDNVAGGKGGCMYSAGAAIVREEVVMRGNVGASGGCLCE